MYGAAHTCNVAFPYREQRRREREKERAPTYLLNIHIQPTYAEYFTHTPSHMEGDSRQTKG